MTLEAPIQGIFDFEGGNPDGYANWRREREARHHLIRAEWSLPVGARVRLTLRNMDGEFEGVLELDREPDSIDRHAPLALRLDRFTFTHRDIESCVVLEAD